MKNDRQEIPGLFVSSGSFNKMKGHFELIQQFSKLDNSNTLEIYGDIHNIDYFNTLQKHIIDNKLDNIKLFEYTDKYIERLKEAEYFCLFSKSEGCCYSILEAISLNKKIICGKKCLTDNMLDYPNLRHSFDIFNKSLNVYDNSYYFKISYEFIINNIINDIAISDEIYKKFYNYISQKTRYDVTVLTPSYNCSRNYLSLLSKSIEDQTFRNNFWLIMNDASSNKDSIDFLNELNTKKNTLVFSNFNNLGLSANRNAGWNKTKSPYILFIDDDDYISNNCIEKYVWYLSNSDNYFVYSHYETFGNRSIEFRYNSDRGSKNLTENGFTSSFMIKNIINLRFDENITTGAEDWDFFLNLFSKNYLGYCLEEINFFYNEKENPRKWRFDCIKNFNTKYENLVNYFPTINKFSNKDINEAEYYQLTKIHNKHYYYLFIINENELKYIIDNIILKKFKINLKRSYFILYDIDSTFNHKYVKILGNITNNYFNLSVFVKKESYRKFIEYFILTHNTVYLFSSFYKSQNIDKYFLLSYLERFELI